MTIDLIVGAGTITHLSSLRGLALETFKIINGTSSLSIYNILSLFREKMKKGKIQSAETS